MKGKEKSEVLIYKKIIDKNITYRHILHTEMFYSLTIT